MYSPGESIVMYGADWCADCTQAKALLDRYNIAYSYKDIDSYAAHKKAMLKATDGKDIIPTIIFGDTVLQEPTNAELIKALGLDMKHDATKSKEVKDVVMIGAGPAALSAAIYTTREDLDTVLFEKGVIGGLAAITDWVDNYPGFPDGISGLDLAEGLRKQAERFGADIRLGEVTNIIEEGSLKKLETTDGDIYAKTVLIATGSDYKKLGIPGELEYYARGVHYCATCDGAFYRDKRLAVVGGGNSAVQEAIFLTRFASKIDLLVRGDQLRASEILQNELIKHKDKITVHYNTETKEIIGKDNLVANVLGYDKKSKKDVTFAVDGVFIFIGLLPNTGFLKSTKIILDKYGMVVTDNNLQTNVEGVFCAGDVRAGATMQIASASGEGATAALMMRKYLEEHNRKH